MKDLKTGELLNTTVSLVDKNKLKGYNKKTGWYINWTKVPEDNEIYALRIAGKKEIQGLLAFKENKEHRTIEGYWIVANPKSNKQFTTEPEYSGIGGHLFAIMAAESKKRGYDGFVEGQAANSDLLKHYLEAFNARWIGGLQFFIDDKAADRLLEVYNWTEE